MKYSHEVPSEIEVPTEAKNERVLLTTEEIETIIQGLIVNYFNKHQDEFDGNIEHATKMWIEVYMPEFRRLIESEPELVDFFHEDPYRCFAFIDDRLYKHILH